ncbi:MAG: hypothetical protein ABII18_06310 [bacterium]|nr:hypothetical protein [bacterium]MBU1918511.1 hypothetical protein [bacterium]
MNLDIAAYIGLGCLLLGFLLNTMHKIGRDSYFYNGLNLVGGLVLAYYSFCISSIPFLILQIIWALVALWGIIKLIYKKRASL